MVSGTVRVDFAGTPTEAKEYARKHGVNYSLSLSKAGNENLPMLSLTYTTIEGREKARNRFAELDWDRDSQLVVPHKRRKTGR